MVSRTLHTDRLLLEPCGAGDHAALLAHLSSPQVRRFLFDGMVPSGRQVTEMIIDSHRNFAAAGFGLWCVRPAGDTEDGALIGTAGLRRLGDEIEVLYTLEPGLWGRGLATEAVAQVLRYGLEELGLERIVAEVDEGNAASARLAERLGMRSAGPAPDRRTPMTRYVMERVKQGG
jgi:RimJ/RimL family protein N-acetyltransferase